MPFRDPIYVLKSDFFRVLGHPARIKILELLRDGERSVSELQAALALDSGGTSQHLAALKRSGLLESRRERTSVYYSVRDPRMFQLLEAANQIIATGLLDATALLTELQDGARNAVDTPRQARH